MKTHTIILACSLLVGCSGTTELPQFDTALNKDPASVVIYNAKDTNHLFLTDYLPTIVAADSITSDAVEIIKTKDGWAEFDAIVTPSTEWLSTINVWKDGKATTLVASKNEVIPTTLTYKGKAEKVSLVGQMTAWRRDVMNFKSDDNENWTIDFALPAGQYQYLIAVDDNQILDPTNAAKRGQRQRRIQLPAKARWCRSCSSASDLDLSDQGRQAIGDDQLQSGQSRCHMAKYSSSTVNGCDLRQDDNYSDSIPGIRNRPLMAARLGKQ